MRHWWHAQVHRLKWPVQASVFVAHFLHHTLAFFVWASLIAHVAIPMIGAGLNMRQISEEARKFLAEGRVSWRGVIAVALVPAVLVALRQAYLSWEGLGDRLRDRGYAPTHAVHWLKWPFRTSRFRCHRPPANGGFLRLDLDPVRSDRQPGRGRLVCEPAAGSGLRLPRGCGREDRLEVSARRIRGAGAADRAVERQAGLSPSSRRGAGAPAQTGRIRSAGDVIA